MEKKGWFIFCISLMQAARLPPTDAEAVCKSAQFRCVDGKRCVWKGHFCGSAQVCHDGSDQIRYNASLHKPEDGIPCRNARFLDNVCLLPAEQAFKNISLCMQDSGCGARRFECRDGGRCISRRSYCDGRRRYCLDGSDEIKFNLTTHREEDGIPCRSKKLLNKVCLLPADQAWKEDQLCNKDEKCPNGRFRCRDGRLCLSAKRFCDGRRNCGDGTDEISFQATVHKPEDGIACRNVWFPGNVCLLPAEQAYKNTSLCLQEDKCGGRQFMCRRRGRCISRKNYCDGRRRYCLDGSDEVTFDPSKHKEEDGIPCRSRKLLNKVCLLPADQAWKEDQLCNKDENCPADRFKCQDGRICLPKKRFCDGRQDCRDGSDEIRYNVSVHKSKDGIACRNLKDVCLLPSDQVFKNTSLCLQDECGVRQFKCRDSGLCIPKRSYCDGSRRYCLDGSDEVLFNALKHQEEHGIPCRSRKLLNKVCLLPADQAWKENQLCNKGGKCPVYRFECQDGALCLSKNKLCDGRHDCSDGSDERFDLSKYKAEDGIPCRSSYLLNSVCLLPADQVWKKDSLCNEGTAVQEACITRTWDALPDAISYTMKVSFGSNTINTQTTTMTTLSMCDLVQGQKYSITVFAYLPSGPVIQSGPEDIIASDARNELMALPGLTDLHSDATCEVGQFQCLDGNKCIPSHRSFCDGYRDCRDGSDEIIYKSSLHFEVGIPCKGRHSSQCLVVKKYMCDGTRHCRDGADEECFCGENNKVLDKIYSSNKCFRCLDGSRILPAGLLCDNIVHCTDLSDECLCPHITDVQGVRLCKNVHWDESSNSSISFSCESSNSSSFASAEICDGRQNCRNGIDESREWCRKSDTECTDDAQDPSSVKCDFTCPFSDKRVKKCDGSPSCTSLRDQCFYCDRSPEFCKLIDHGRFNLYYCDDVGIGRSGYELCDDVIHCKDRTDELFCPLKFYCKGGSPLHIPKEKKCDLQKDCLDESDELDCRDNRPDDCKNNETDKKNCARTHFYCDDGGKTKYVDRRRKVCDGNVDCSSAVDECQNCTQGAFSNDEWMISAKPMIPFLWLISIFALVGNSSVIVKTIRKLWKKGGRMNPEALSQNILLFNLSVADLLVGIYTTSICFLNYTLSRQSYCRSDHEWRSGKLCSALGSILLIGSEQSVFALTGMTAFRLFAVLRPFSKPSIRKLCLVMCGAWLVSITLAVIPVVPVSLLEDYFVESIWYPENSFITKLEREQVGTFTKRMIALQNIDSDFIKEHGEIGSWSLAEALIRNINPEYIAKRRFGYYSSHGVCMPRLFPDKKEDAAWAYSLMFILINFVAFLFILAGYVLIYFKVTKSNIATSSSANRASKLQGRVTRIVITDFFCWVPVCVMAFVQLSGTDIPTEVYVPVAMIIIPINSAINPFIYSDLVQTIVKKSIPICAFLTTRLRSNLPHLGGAVNTIEEGVEMTNSNRDRMPMTEEEAMKMESESATEVEITEIEFETSV